MSVHSRRGGRECEFGLSRSFMYHLWPSHLAPVSHFGCSLFFFIPCDNFSLRYSLSLFTCEWQESPSPPVSLEAFFIAKFNWWKENISAGGGERDTFTQTLVPFSIYLDAYLSFDPLFCVCTLTCF